MFFLLRSYLIFSVQYKRASVVDTFFCIQTVLLQATYSSLNKLIFDLEEGRRKF